MWYQQRRSLPFDEYKEVHYHECVLLNNSKLSTVESIPYKKGLCVKHSFNLMVLASMISLSPLTAAKTILEQLETAVSGGNLLEVKSYLRKLDRQPMTPQEKKSIFSDLLGMSEDTLESEKATGEFLGDKCDIARCIAGALVGVYGLSQVVHNSN